MPYQILCPWRHDYVIFLRHSLISTAGLQQQLEDWVDLSADAAVPNLVLFFATPQAKASFEVWAGLRCGTQQSLSTFMSYEEGEGRSVVKIGFKLPSSPQSHT